MNRSATYKSASSIFVFAVAVLGLLLVVPAVAQEDSPAAPPATEQAAPKQADESTEPKSADEGPPSENKDDDQTESKKNGQNAKQKDEKKKADDSKGKDSDKSTKDAEPDEAKPKKNPPSEKKDSEDKKDDKQPAQPTDDEEKEGDEEKSDELKENDEEKEDKDQQENQQEDAEDQSDSAADSIRSLFNRQSEDAVRFSKNAEEFILIFKPVVADAAKSTVKIMSGRRQLALGIVVDVDGHILTKASELTGELSCRFPDGREASAKVLGVHPETDLAMLTVTIDDVYPVRWSESAPPLVGQWLATPNGEKSILDVGIVGVGTRVIPHSSPFIGITMRDVKEKNGVKVDLVVNGSPADEADLLVGDLITKIDNIETVDIESLRKTLGQYDPNDRITLSVIRAGQPLEIKLTLAEVDKVSPAHDRSNQQNSMGSVLSRRRKDFPSAFQHDSMLNSKTCGGPIVNLDGEVIGVNIARAGRVASLALPTSIVLPVIAELKTGKLAPAVVNKARIEAIDLELADIDSKLNTLPSKKSNLETQFEIEKAKKEELERILKDVQDRLKIIELKSDNLGTELDSIKRTLKNIDKVREQLKSDREQLSTGVR